MIQALNQPFPEAEETYARIFPLLEQFPEDEELQWLAAIGKEWLDDKQQS